MKKLDKAIVILGPTASGKTALSLSLADKFNGEIVSADSRQIYREMDIGTAKPTAQEMGEIKHHLIDIKNPDEDYTVAEFKNDAITAINDITKRKKLPIIAGGTGLYISALVDNLDIPRVGGHKKIRAKLEKEIEKYGLDFVYKKLLELDPEAAYIVDPKNPRRVIRALEVALATGKSFTSQRKKGKPLFNFLQIGLNPPPEKLKKRIADRVAQMIKDGLVKEVKEMIKKYRHNYKTFDTIGYREIIDYLDKKITLDEATAQITKNTRHYARRQITWLKRDKRIKWVKNPEKIKNEVGVFLNSY